VDKDECHAPRVDLAEWRFDGDVAKASAAQLDGLTACQVNGAEGVLAVLFQLGFNGDSVCSIARRGTWRVEYAKQSTDVGTTLEGS
jgi:hypothetical protein